MRHSVICVTGGTGFVGQGVVSELLENGFHIRALIRNKNSAKKLASLKSKYPTQLEYIIGDATDPKDVRIALEGADAMVHLVGIRREEIKKTGLSYVNVDLGSALATADAMDRSGVKRILFLSAGAIGHSEYVQTKARAEQVIMNANLDWTIFRPAFIIGPGQQWPVFMGPILSFFGLFPGKFGDIARKSGNITRNRLAEAFVTAFQNDRFIGEILEIPELKRL